jgi:hypothetical protein
MQANEHSVSYFAAHKKKYYCSAATRYQRSPPQAKFQKIRKLLWNNNSTLFFRNNNSTSSAPLAPFGGAPTDCRKEILQFHTLSGGRDPWLEPGLMIADEFALTVKIFMFAEK